jgi:hypothetical protein
LQFRFWSEARMPQPDDSVQRRNWLSSVLTDIHFWVPVAMLLAGLLLLRFIH